MSERMNEWMVGCMDGWKLDLLFWLLVEEGRLNESITQNKQMMLKNITYTTNKFAFIILK